MNAVALAPWVQDERDAPTLKRAFAAALLYYPTDPFKAALQLFPNNTMRALTVAQEWIADPFVLNAQAELIAELGEDHFLPSKVTLARRVFELGENVRASQSEKLSAFRLYAELRGFIEKPGFTVQNNTNILNQNRVMLMTDHGSNEDWETKALAQQTKLVEHSRD
jgi:hypothetical protein